MQGVGQFVRLASINQSINQSETFKVS